MVGQKRLAHCRVVPGGLPCVSLFRQIQAPRLRIAVNPVGKNWAPMFEVYGWHAGSVVQRTAPLFGPFAGGVDQVTGPLERRFDLSGADLWKLGRKRRDGLCPVSF